MPRSSRRTVTRSRKPAIVIVCVPGPTGLCFADTPNNGCESKARNAKMIRTVVSLFIRNLMDRKWRDIITGRYSLTLGRSSRYNPRQMKFRAQIMGRLLMMLACLANATVIARAQQRPLITEDVDIIPQGTVRIEAGLDFLQGAKFPASGLTGDLTRVGVLGISIGFAPNVEFQIEGVVRNFLSINTRGASAIPLSFAPGTNSTNDTGDFILWTKFKLRSETRRGPSLGFRVGVGLPNSNQARGIG